MNRKKFHSNTRIAPLFLAHFNLIHPFFVCTPIVVLAVSLLLLPLSSLWIVLVSLCVDCPVDTISCRLEPLPASSPSLSVMRCTASNLEVSLSMLNSFICSVYSRYTTRTVSVYMIPVISSNKRFYVYIVTVVYFHYHLNVVTISVKVWTENISCKTNCP